MNPSAAHSEPFEEGADEFDPRQILTILLERKWLIAGCVILALAAGVAYLKLTSPVYRATALIEVPEQGRNAAGFDEQDYSGDEVLNTIERNLQRLSLIRRVLERPEIRDLKPFKDSFDEPVESMNPIRVAENVRDWSRIQLEKGTRLIMVSVEHTDPALAKDLSNAIIEEFVKERAEMRSGSSASAAESLVGEAERIGKQLRESQGLLEKMKDAIALREKIEEQEDELATLTQRYGDAHPSVVQLRSFIADLNADLKAELKRLKPRLPQDDPVAGGNGNPAGEDAVEAEFERLNAYFESLSGEVTTTQALFEAILVRMKETDVTRELMADQIKVVEDAYLPTKPIKPKKVQVLAASVVLGGGLGLFLAWGLYALNRSLRTVDEAERAIGVPVLAAIPTDSRIPEAAWLEKESKRQIASLIEQFADESASGRSTRKKRPKGTIEPLVMLSDPGSPLSEAFRTLRASLTLMNQEREKKHRSFLITSSVPGEGKSFVAANLAIAFAAQEGLRTLLIDADLRHPMVSRLFALDAESGGLIQALTTGDVQVTASGIGNLDLLPAGTPTHHPAELLSGPRFGELLIKLTESFDRIVIDSAPVNVVADSLLIAPHVDSSILVARAGFTPREAIVHARDLLDDAGRKPDGFVLNGLPKKAGMAGNPYYYCYGPSTKGYGKNYG